PVRHYRDPLQPFHRPHNSQLPCDDGVTSIGADHKTSKFYPFSTITLNPYSFDHATFAPDSPHVHALMKFGACLPRVVGDSSVKECTSEGPARRLTPGRRIRCRHSIRGVEHGS